MISPRPETQHLLPLVDPQETREARLERLLSGDVGKYITTAARTFTDAEAERAERLAYQSENETKLKIKKISRCATVGRGGGAKTVPGAFRNRGGPYRFFFSNR